MSRKIKVHYYTITPTDPNISFSQVLNIINSTPLSQRARLIGQGGVNLEIIQQQGNSYFLHLTSARIRDWPGIGGNGQPSTDLILGGASELTENTYAAFDSSNGRLVLHYSQSGVRATRLFSYIDSFTGTPGSFSFFPILNNNALHRYQNKYSYTEIEAVINDITQADIAIFNGSSISNSIRESIQAGATQVSLGFKVDARVKSNRINRGFINNLASKILQRSNTSDKLVVSGRDQSNSKVEPIDLLEDVKTYSYDERAVTLTPGRRYRISDMQTLLFDALTK